MNNLTNIKGENNKIIFTLPDNTNITHFTDTETNLLNKAQISLSGNNNTLKINIRERKDIETFLKRDGLFILVVGHNNTINLGEINYTINPILNITGLQIHIGGAPDPFKEPDKPRYADNCTVEIGDETVFCGTRIYLQDNNSSVKIGKNCMFSWGIDVWCTDVHTITDMDGNALNYGKKIDIGSHVWVGKDVKIGKNTKISDNSIVGWASIVTKEFNETNVILAGNPAKIVKRNINWDYRDLQNYALYYKSGQ